MFRGPKYVHSRIMEALEDECTGPLTLLFDMFLLLFELQRDLKDAIISQVYKARSRDLAINCRFVSLSNAFVKLMEKSIQT